MMMWVFIALLLAVGLYGIFAKRNVIKKILGLVVVEHAINLFLVSVGYRAGGEPPILTEAVRDADPTLATFAAQSVDPLPQALVLTSIVIGLGVVMLLVALTQRIRQRAGTLDTANLNELRG